ncbi:MAG: hypothetical protein ACXWEW_09265 [Nitrososphaeraceae archaeon]
MSNNDEEWDKVKLWAEKITKIKDEEKKKTTNTISTLKYIIILIVIVSIALGLIYIVYRAYTVPEPLTLQQEVSKMIESNQKVYYERRHDPVVGAGLHT